MAAAGLRFHQAYQFEPCPPTPTKIKPPAFVGGFIFVVGRLGNLVLFDPGATSDIAGSKFFNRGHGCDFEYDVNKLLADWLTSDSQNHLMVIAGADTEMKEDPNDPSSHSTFAAMWKYYFAGIWNKPFADRALVCDYNVLSHNDTLRDFAGIVKNPTDNCPDAPEGHRPQAWHP